MRRLAPLALVMYMCVGLSAEAMAQQLTPVKPQRVKPATKLKADDSKLSKLSPGNKGKLKIVLKSQTQFVSQIRCEIFAEVNGQPVSSPVSSPTHSGAQAQSSSELTIAATWSKLRFVCHPGNANQSHEMIYTNLTSEWISGNEVVVGCGTTQSKCTINSNPR